jgi:hypothetical protein
MLEQKIKGRLMDSTDTPNASVTVHLYPFYRPLAVSRDPNLLSITLKGHAHILYLPKSSSFSPSSQRRSSSGVVSAMLGASLAIRITSSLT